MWFGKYEDSESEEERIAKKVLKKIREAKDDGDISLTARYLNKD